LLAGALAAGSLVACGDDDGGTPPIDARQTQDGPVPPQPPPPPPDAEAVDAEAVDAEASDDAQLP
jgi:hypothetical protein